MWRVNKIGKEQVWYEAELIEKIKAECQEAIDAYDKEQFYEDDCDKFMGESFMAQRILELIKEKE
jgi:hypothetical protein